MLEGAALEAMGAATATPLCTLSSLRKSWPASAPLVPPGRPSLGGHFSGPGQTRTQNTSRHMSDPPRLTRVPSVLHPPP